MADAASPAARYKEANRLKNEGDLGGAVSVLESLVEDHPTMEDAHCALAVYLQRLGREEEAIEHARKVAELNPDDSFSYSQLSVIYQRCGKIPEAEEAMAKARMIQMRG